MTTDPGHLAHARQVADAVLYEGYLLYPYRQSAQKNRSRFQFGVLMPPAYRAVDDCEPSVSQTECLLECADDAVVEILVRFLHFQRRTVQRIDPGTGAISDVETLTVNGVEYTCWDEAVEREQSFYARVGHLLGVETELLFRVSEGEELEGLTGPDEERAGRLVRRWERLDAAIDVRAERVAGPYGALRLQVRVENRSQPRIPLRSRDDGLRYSLIAAHVLVAVPGGTFLSLTDPPQWAAAEAAVCTNIGTWPVLAGPDDCRDLLLSSPVILYDHPEVAPESAGDLFDATEIDEILTLRTLALTDDERREARATDPRAAELIDRLDVLPPEMLERMHGAIRYLSPSGPLANAGAGGTASAAGPQVPKGPGVPGDLAMPTGTMPSGVRAVQPGDLAAPPAVFMPPSEDFAVPSWGTPGDGDPAVPSWETPAGAERKPWWDPGSDASVSPETDHVLVGGVRIARGSRVRMRPGSRRADAQDLFLVGREAIVEAVLHDVDGHVHVAVSPTSDPLADLQRNHGRFLYFAPDEIEPVETAPVAGGRQPGIRDEPTREEEST
jgi:hypothetical protein